MHCSEIPSLWPHSVRDSYPDGSNPAHIGHIQSGEIYDLLEGASET